MPEKAIKQKIAQLTELLNSPDRNEGNVLRVYYELFQLSHEGRDLSLDTVKWLNESASLFLSVKLLNVLTKLRLDVYGFKFAALNFIDIDDVIFDLSNGEVLKSVHSLPPGAFNKLKRQLLSPPPPRPQPQQQAQSQPTLGKTPHQQPSRRNYFAAPSSTSSSASSRGNDRDEWEEDEEDPGPDFVRQRGRRKGSGAFYKKRKVAPATGPAVPRVNPPLLALTDKQSQGYDYPPVYEPPFQPPQYQEFGDLSIVLRYSNYPSAGMVPLLDGAPVYPPLVALQRHTANLDINGFSALIARVQQISSHGLLTNIPDPQYSPVPIQTEGENVLFDKHCKLYRYDEEEWNEHGLGQLKLLCDPSSEKVRLLMRRDRGLKVCANHAITSDLKFAEVKATKNTWMWSSIDFTDDDKGKLEKFAARFETEEESGEFRKVLERVQSSQQPPAQLVFENQFTPKVGSWPCVSCYVNNQAEAVKCIACDTAKPVAVMRASSCPTDSFHGTGTTAFERNSKSVNERATPAATKHLSTLVPSTSFVRQDSTGSRVSFGSVSSPARGFNKPASFSTSELDKPIFGSTNGEGEDREGSSPRFIPIIPLPDKVDVKTSEEDEEMAFSYRAKLYRFDASTKEWKEKGVGDIKILHHREKNTYRMIMRRDLVHKLVCNHWITPEMVLKPHSKSKAVWTWFAMDFAQNELLPEHFAVRFKLEDTAHLFYRKFIECQSTLKVSVPNSYTSVTSVTQSFPATKEDDDKEQEEDEEKDTDQSINSSEGKSDVNDEPDWHAALLPASDTD